MAALAIVVMLIVFLGFAAAVVSNGRGVHVQRHTITEVKGGHVYRSTATQVAVGQPAQPLPPPVYHQAIEAHLVRDELPPPTLQPALVTGPSTELEDAVKAYIAGSYDAFDRMAFESFLDGVAKQPALYSTETHEVLRRYADQIAIYRNPFDD